MAKTDTSLTSISPHAPGEKAFMDLFRKGMKNVNADKLANNGQNGINNAGKNVKIFPRSKFHFGNNMAKSIEDYDKEENQNESDVTALRLKNAHKKHVTKRTVYDAKGRQIAVVTGAKNNREAAKGHHAAEVVKELFGKGKLKSIQDFHHKSMTDKMDDQRWGHDDKMDPDRTGDISFHKAMRAFHLNQMATSPLQRGDKDIHRHDRSIRNWDRRDMKKYDEHKKKRPNLAGGTLHSNSGHIGSFNEEWNVNETSSALLGRYIKKASRKMADNAYAGGYYYGRQEAAQKSIDSNLGKTGKDKAKYTDERDMTKDQGKIVSKKIPNRDKGIRRATDKLLNRSIVETLGSDAKVSDYIHDFVHSNDSRFEGKSKKERIKMALGAYYGNHHEGEVVPISSNPKYKVHPSMQHALHYDNEDREMYRKQAKRLGRIKPGQYPKSVNEKHEDQLPWLKQLADRVEDKRRTEKEVKKSIARHNEKINKKKTNEEVMLGKMTLIENILETSASELKVKAIKSAVQTEKSIEAKKDEEKK